MTPSTDRYGHLAAVLHWALAALVPVLIGLGWYMLSIEKEPGSGWYFALHMSLGLTAGALIGLRIVWRLRHPAPPLPKRLAAWQAHAARLSHGLLYVLLALMPTTGYLGASFSGEPIAWFGVPLPMWAGKDDALKEQFFGVHSVVAWLLVAVVCVHVLAALKHLAVDRVNLFRRIWPW